jgi:hypothetical protein
MNFSIIYFYISIILSVIGTIIVGIINYDNYFEKEKINAITVIASLIITSFMWPELLLLAILSLVTILPLWLIYKAGRFVGKLFLNNGE